ncbi:hemin ABC transporter substrate-binding protein [Alteromonas mediterranea]|uniref:Hemin ABC transporter substrate-binding protein n=1 Tax=Alteromonas mediterranea TaxID=314275 RepID=A0AAC9JBZ4_9ALTE|nr:ABC transporter substrate-binding protein [Alteromonas mediterranea]APD90910.1 hemin ABC transporter substrate-binding protein [Alteromonas mediterranea]QDG36008.1 hemin ABC transporter substrate-binding protein [Alteromonas mediterranea]QGX62926.1 ABC transporter substrate-binding protein [Alteromonas mediterranea]
MSQHALSFSSIAAKAISAVMAGWSLFTLGAFSAPLEETQTVSPRIVTAGGSITEIVFALGRGDWVIATDSTSMFPQEAASLTKLGYFRQLSTEGVLAQQPTMLLGAEASGPSIALEQIAHAGVDVTTFEVDKNLSGLKALVLDIGKKLAASEQAIELIHHIEKKVEQQKARHADKASAFNKPIKALFVVANNDRGITVAGKDTVPQALFDTLGIVNIGESVKGYKVMDAESVLMQNPDIVIAAGHMLRGKSAKEALCTHHALATTFAGKHCLVEAMDSSISLGLSPRFHVALQHVAEYAEKAIEIKQTQKTANSGTSQ